MYKELISPVLDRLDSETWHERARDALHTAESHAVSLKLLEWLAAGGKRFQDERLRVVVGGVSFENPLIVGAGWDKAGKAVRALYTLGFASVEVGTVLVHPQAGNPKPRQFMLGPGVALNKLGFNSPGMEVVAQNIERYRGSGIPVGISLGKNRDVELCDAPLAYATVARRFYQDAAYFAVNVSSPNTPGLRALQDKAALTDIIQAIHAVMDEFGARKPLFVKIAPELTPEATNDVISVVLDHGLAGIIATNTIASPEIKARYGERWRSEGGGVSGDDAEFRRISNEKIAYIYRETAGKVDIIGVGGVKDMATALEKIRAGARAVQIVTGIRGEGTRLPGRINRGLVAYLEREGLRTVHEITGCDAGRI